MAGGVNEGTFDFEGNAGPVLAEMRKILTAHKQLEDANKTLAASSERATKAAQEGLKAQTREIERLREATARQQAKMMELADKSAERWAFLGKTIGAGAVVAGLSKIASLHGEINKKLADQEVAYDRIGRKVMLQAAMSETEFRQTMKKNLAPAAKDYGMSINDAQELAVELMNQGIDKKQAIGGGVFRETMNMASAVGSSDPAAMARGAIGFLKGRGEDVNAESMRKFAVPMAGLFKDFPIQEADIAALAPVGAATKELGISQEDALSTYTSLKQIGFDAGSAATGVRNVALNLAAPNKITKEMLERTGGAGSVDKVNPGKQGFVQALQNFSDISGRIQDRGVRDQLYEQMFGKENMAAGSRLTSAASMKSIGEIRKSMSEGQATFDANIAARTTGAAAASNRADVDLFMTEENARKRAAVSERVLKNLDIARAQEGQGWLRRTVASGIDRGAMAIGETVFGGPEAPEIEGGAKSLDELNRAQTAAYSPEKIAVAGPAAFVAPKSTKYAPLGKGFNPLGADVESENAVLRAKTQRDQVQGQLDDLEARKSAREAEYKRGDGRTTSTERRKLDKEFGAEESALVATLKRLDASLNRVEAEQRKRELQRNTGF